MEEILGQPTATFRKAEPDTPSDADFGKGTRQNSHCINETTTQQGSVLVSTNQLQLKSVLRQQQCRRASLAPTPPLNSG